MRKLVLLVVECFWVFLAAAQSKQPLDHTVYDGWQSIGERVISNNGQWVAYVIAPQEGDGWLVIEGSDGGHKLVIDRGYGAVLTADNRYAVFKVKPFFKDTRQAKIKKKKPEEQPKDSLGIVDLGTGTLKKVPNVKGFRLPEKAGNWLAYQLEKPLGDSTKQGSRKDSTGRKIDTLIHKKDGWDAEGDDKKDGSKEEGSDLVLLHLTDGTFHQYHLVGDYAWSKQGNLLTVELTGRKKDSVSKGAFCVWRPSEEKLDTLLKGVNDLMQAAIDESGNQVAFLAERDSSAKALQKFYKLWYYKKGMDSARLLAGRNTPGMQLGWSLSENGLVSFSKSGGRLMLGTAPVRAPKDTTLVDMDLVKVDVWNYHDDYLQPMQLKNQEQELKRSYLAVYNLATDKLVQLADEKLPTVVASNEGDGDWFLGVTDYGKRVPMQWTGYSLKDVYAINPLTGERKLAKADLDGNASISPGGHFLLWYDQEVRQYFTYDAGGVHSISAAVGVPLYDEENDVPDDPNAYGVMGWLQKDQSVLVYDRYDVWELDPLGKRVPLNVTAGMGRRTKRSFRYVRFDKDEQGLAPMSVVWFRVFNDSTKQYGFAQYKLHSRMLPLMKAEGPFVFNQLVKAKQANMFLFTKESYTMSPDLYATGDFNKVAKLSAINPQQQRYNWGTSELVKWNTFNGHASEGILYKPEDFDSTRQYPMIVYFYERLSDGLYAYVPPAPTPSRLNISFFVSRGYLVFVPDIRYETGHPGKSAYEYIVSGVQWLMKSKWVDGKNIAIQGQSWGGYQVAYLVTATNLFKAAWAGAPVANMFSAYGGIRWESGMNRQFQYEHTQSRIGATIWEKPELYVENSPLFHLPNVTTPLVIMSNDADGAVPWYQGIELFTGLRRLGKPVWLLNYNGEAHNLMERRNRKDIQIREQQFFDWMLKGATPARWLMQGVPATEKGRAWGLETEKP